MEHMHPHLRLAASLILAAGLASACSGGSSGSGTAAPAAPDPDPAPEPTQPTVTRTPEGCTDASPTCTVTRTAADGTRTVTVTTNMADMTAMTNTRTVTAGTARTITVTSTADGHNNRVNSVLTCTVSGDSCTPTRRVVTAYPDAGATGDPVTTTTVYTGGRPSSRTVGDVTTSIAYSASGGGRTETTVTSGGTRVQTFGQFSGGTAASTTFTSTDGLTVTTAHADGMRRVETVYASAAAKDAGTPASVTVGDARMVNRGTAAMPDNVPADTGFTGAAVRTFYVANPVAANPLVPSSGTLVAWTRSVAYDGDGDATLGAITSRTYITERDDDGRETERQTLMVSGSAVTAGGAATPGTDGSATTTVTTSYPEAGGMVATTVVAGTSWTRVTTDADGEVTTVVRDGASDTDDIVTTTVASPAADDGSRTVATTYGAGAPDGGPASGTTVSVRTLSNGNRVTTTSTGTGDDRVVSLMVTTDALGVETERVAYSNSQNTRTTTTTAYMTSGASTVTTVTATRASATAAYATATTVVVTNDAMGRVVLSVTTDKDGDETDRRVSVYAADGARTETRTFSGGTGDLLMDTGIRTWDKDGDLTSDIVVHPGVQDHAIVSDAQYDMIQKGLALRENATTVMGQAVLHLSFNNDPAFASFITSRAANAATDVELELFTQSPTCAANGSCTYQGLRYEVEPEGILPELRVYNSTDDTSLVAGTRGTPGAASADFWNSIAWDGPPAVYNAASRTVAGLENESTMHRLLADLLNVGGAGVSAAYTQPSDGYEVDDDPHTDSGANIPADETGARVAVTPTATTDLERNTFTYLKTSGLADGVIGIGQQEKRVNSYRLLGGSRDNPATANDNEERAVEVTVQNYFGWLENSMFTVRRVVAANIGGAGYDWKPGAGAPGNDNEIRAYIGMVSGDPSIRPEERRTAGMVDPGTWSGEMLGVGSIQGERYRGDAQVTVSFANNNVTTAFSNIRFATDSASDIQKAVASARFISPDLANDPTTGIGISFISTGINGNGSFTSNDLRGGAGYTADIPAITTGANGNSGSTLSAQFYGENAAEVAGTFNAFGLALGPERTMAQTIWSDSDMDDGRLRGDIIGAFGATRDPMTEAPEDDN